MSLRLSVEGPDQWELVYSDSLKAAPTYSYYRRRLGPMIEPFDVPVVFDSHILAIAAEYKEAPPTWYNCATIIQLATGATINDRDTWSEELLGTEPIIISRHSLRLNLSLEMFQFQPVSNELRIGIIPMPWVPEFSFGIYQYNGTVTDSTEDLIEATQVQLAVVGAKVDDLRSRP